MPRAAIRFPGASSRPTCLRSHVESLIVGRDVQVHAGALWRRRIVLFRAVNEGGGPPAANRCFALLFT